MADIRARVKGLTERVAGAVPGSIQRSASQLGGGVAGVAQSVAAPVASGLEKMGAAAMAERVKAGASAVAGFQKNQLPGMENLTGSRVLGYGGMAAGLLGAGAAGLAAGVAASRQSEEKRQRMAGDRPLVGGNVMPADLQAGYLNLAVPGSPLGGMGLLSGNHLRQGQNMQDMLVAQQHRMKDSMVISRGNLPLSYQTSEED